MDRSISQIYRLSSLYSYQSVKICEIYMYCRYFLETVLGTFWTRYQVLLRSMLSTYGWSMYLVPELFLVGRTHICMDTSFGNLHVHLFFWWAGGPPRKNLVQSLNSARLHYLAAHWWWCCCRWPPCSCWWRPQDRQSCRFHHNQLILPPQDRHSCGFHHNHHLGSCCFRCWFVD